MGEEPSQEKEDSLESSGGYIGFGGLLAEMIRVFFLAVIIIIPVRVFLFQPFFVQGSSMEPNFEDGQYLVISELGYKQTAFGWSQDAPQLRPFKELARQDVVVFRFPRDTEQFFIKRVIGLPGESVEIHQGKVIIYNSTHPNGFVIDESSYLSPDVITKDMPRTEVAQDQYFVMGDNRPNSYDSRAFGPVNKDKILGRVLLRAWPMKEFSIY